MVNLKNKKFDWIDLGLLKVGMIAFTLMIAKLWPPILNMEWYIYLIIGIVLIIRPLKSAYID